MSIRNTVLISAFIIICFSSCKEKQQQFRIGSPSINEPDTVLNIPIWFKEYGIEILDIPRIGDTIFYNTSSRDQFKLVFFDRKGKCYIERYVYGKIYETGYYTNSLDTLKRYVSGRTEDGRSTLKVIQRYFEPLRNGEWIRYEKKDVIKSKYNMGICN